jgi:hypothetical protein
LLEIPRCFTSYFSNSCPKSIMVISVIGEAI